MRIPKLLVAALLSCSFLGCRGLIIIDEGSLGTGGNDGVCGGEICGANEECVNSRCMPRADECAGATSGICLPCSPANPEGSCGAGETCVAGICYVNGQQPVTCATNRPGWCQDGFTCTANGCQQILTSCSAQDPTGDCTGTGVCIEGSCYADVQLRCSPTNGGGFCPNPPDQICDLGSCEAVQVSCGPTNPTGLCPAWQTCVNGECVGPTPPDACAPDPAHINGRCPAAEVCVSGVCQPITATNQCSVDNSNGLCPAGAACQDGGCVAITSANDCSFLDPTGTCPGGGICLSGVCRQVTCQDGGNQCPDGSYCDGLGTCQPSPCDPVHPQGACANSLEVCDRGVCGAPPCSPSNTQGACTEGFSCCDDTLEAARACTLGTCVLDECSPAFEFGYCPAGEACCGAAEITAGLCGVPDRGSCVEGPCSPSNTDGLCLGVFEACKPGVGCGAAAGLVTPEVCCDAGLAGSLGCALGTCNPPVCSLTEPNGRCTDPGESDGSHYCDATLGDCVPADCSTIFPLGTCDDPRETCYLGSCHVFGCRDEVDPDGFCGAGGVPLVCDLLADVCVRAPCSPVNPDGACVARTEVCCNPTYEVSQGCTGGACFAPDCALEFPGGACASGEICAGGRCVVPPCTVDFPNGNCGPNYFCDLGTCRLANCDAQNLQGFCPNPGPNNVGQRCVSGACEDYVCSATFPTGPCPIGTLCLNDVCSTPSCGPGYPGGSCPANEVCINNACRPGPCSPAFPGGECAAGFVCNTGHCDAANCSASSPAGPCVGVDFGKVCVAGVCQVYQCNASFPTGPCAVPGQLCLNNACRFPNCGELGPGGVCAGAGEVCVAGQCVLPGCSATVQNGACPAGQQCCTAALSSSQGCTTGTCTLLPCNPATGQGTCAAGQVCVTSLGCRPFTCGTDFLNGPCPTPGDVCVGGTCQPADCGPSYPGGACAGVGEVCVNGVCVLPACSAINPFGACPANQSCCDPTLQADRSCVLGTCVVDDCALAFDTGYCDPGQICCSSAQVASGFCTAGQRGTCRPTTCSPAFPFGSCVNSGEICVGGACTQVCSPSRRSGWCPSGFGCVDGACSPSCASDTDCDGITDAHETLASSTDTDLDGSPDGRDRDSDADFVPDAIEAGDFDPGTLPVNSDGVGAGDWRVIDADGDHISDTYEAGPAVTAPRDSDSDGLSDYRDRDSDNDGIPDSCEVSDTPSICGATGVVTPANVKNSDVVALGYDDGVPDYRDLDSDEDGIYDCHEALVDPTVQPTACLNGLAQPAGTLWAGNVNHDGAAPTPVASRDQIPDYRDTDSDGDGVVDAEEDLDGDTKVDCQLDGSGNPVPDTRVSPACGATTGSFAPPALPYNFNPGCPGQKCLLGETSRIHLDSDGDGISDGNDGIYLVCSEANLKPINVFYSQQADYALAMEQEFDRTFNVSRAGRQAGATFDDTTAGNGSAGVSAFVLNRVPAAAAVGTTNATDPVRELIDKAIAQEAADRALLATAPGVTGVSLVINRNFTSFDGYGVLVSRYTITASATNTWVMRNRLAFALDGTVTGYNGASSSPSSETSFTLLTQTVYRWDNDNPASPDGVVMVVAALTPTGANSDDDLSYSYRPKCSSQTLAACPNRPGCLVQGSTCVENANYQIPLFFADNIASGSALAQWGDDLDSLCQSMIQRAGKLDFLWTVDSSGSMAEEIAQVQIAAKLFVGLLNTTEADYRLGQTTSNNGTGGNATSFASWEPQFDFSSGVEFTNASTTSETSDEPGGVNGYLTGEFTGAIGGVVNGSATDRSVTYTCSEGCFVESCFGLAQNACGAGTANPECRWNGSACEPDCCPGCANQAGSTSFNDPACYFASRLPDVDGNGDEHTLLMANWAAFRAGAAPHCTGAASSGACTALAGCAWVASTCVPATCVPPAGVAAYTQETCNGNDPDPGDCSPLSQSNCQNAANTARGCLWTGSACIANRLFDVPYGADTNDDEAEPPMCEWNAVANACYPNVTGACSSFAGATSAESQAVCTGACATLTTQATCQANAGCQWFASGVTGWTANPTQCRSLVCAAYTAQALCDANPACIWYNPPSSSNNRCTDRGAATCYAQMTQAPCDAIPACQWRTSGTSACFPRASVAVSRCEWDGGGNACIPTARAHQALCTGTTQDQCVAGSGNFCQWNAGSSTCSVPAKRAMRSDAARVAVVLTDEEECLLKDTNFDGDCEEDALTGSGFAATDPLRLARTESFLRSFQSRDFTVFGIVGDKNTGCATAAPCNTAIAVAEGTGGGWGSICAADLYPTIEAIIIASLGKASPYKLEGFIAGNAVQPIASTLKVAVQVCSNPLEYPLCASGSVMTVVPRSRENGFDYDALNNTLVLYGSARPKAGGDITASYRYWIDLPQLPDGDPDCPCPETNLGACACPGGQACGYSGTLAGGIANTCGTAGTPVLCSDRPGCTWNTATGVGCVPNGLCDPDPTCGGPCPVGEVCDPTRGLCVCDPACNSLCGAGDTCDNNNNVNPCEDLAQGACTGACEWISTLNACFSVTCGQCLCDFTCGGGCPVGSLCDDDLLSATCGSCACDTSCGDDRCVLFPQATCAANGCNWDGAECRGCAAGLTCDDDPASASCGFCQAPQCGNCPAGFVCDTATGLCICDTTCGGTCPAGTYCQGDTGQPACGQCLCDPTCGEPACDIYSGQVACEGGGCYWDAATSDCTVCISGTTCDPDPGPTCGLCISDLDCSAGCNAPCSYPGAGACNADPACRWAPWLNPPTGACHPRVCELCDGATGLCLTDPTCCGACGADNSGGNLGDECSLVTGSCECDVSCGGACPAGRVCDSDPANIATCGSCVCDPSCGDTTCNPKSQAQCTPASGCFWDAGAAECRGCPSGTLCDAGPGSATCGLCLADPTCGVPGGNCNAPCGALTSPAACAGNTECRWADWLDPNPDACVPITCALCNPTAGFCLPDPDCCGACSDTETCNAVTGRCECDTDCDFACNPGTTCDSSLVSPTCGQCQCDQTCGQAGCNLGAQGPCESAGCFWIDGACRRCGLGTVCDSGGQCANRDTTPGGSCESYDGDGNGVGDCIIAPAGDECLSPNCGVCVIDRNCGGRCNPATEDCNPTTGLCQPRCPNCPTGQVCDPLSGTCICDQTCGVPCPLGSLCDGDSASPTCGQCVCDTDCGAEACAQGTQVACEAVGCFWDGTACTACGTGTLCDSLPGSPSCGRCIVDPLCGGGCPSCYECNTATGLCVPDPACCSCDPGYCCHPVTQLCVPDEGGGCQ